jgi:hypothetical protein
VLLDEDGLKGGNRAARRLTMIVIGTQQLFQKVANLPFCYWCGGNFLPQDQTNRDHVPPSNAFDVHDRTPPLILKTHVDCNSAHKTTDELIGQLVALQRNYVTPDPKNRRLKMEVYPGQSFGAVTNVDVIGAVWRYIRGIHAALYREPLLGAPQGTMTTPFTRGRIVDNELVLGGPKQEQHFAIVQTIKNQRAIGNVDRIVSNNGKLTYECVWVWAEDVNAVMSGQRPMMRRRACFFALDIYGWKELGDVGQFPARGCAGAYSLPDGHAPAGASLYIESATVAANQDPWDPFGP